MARKPKYDESWPTDPHKRRVVHHFVLNYARASRPLELMRRRWVRAVNRAIKAIYAKVRSGDYIMSRKGAAGGGRPALSDTNIVTVVKGDHPDLFAKSVCVMEGERSAVVKKAVEVVKAYVGRYKDKIKGDPGKLAKKPPYITKKVVSFEGKYILDETPFTPGDRDLDFKKMSDEESLLARAGTMVVSFGGPKDKRNKIRLFYVVAEGQVENKTYLAGKEFGGNLKWDDDDNSCWLAAGAKVPINWAYPPGLDTIAWDDNWNERHGLVLNDGRNFRRSKRMAELIKKLDDLNDKIKVLRGRKKELAGRTRTGDQQASVDLEEARLRLRLLRQGVNVVQHQMEEEVEGLCRKLCDEAFRRKALVCVDELKVGSLTGSFGHDAFSKVMVRMCEDRGIPFVEVPTPNTSKFHLECGGVIRIKEGRERGQCMKCNKVVSCHVTAAKTIAVCGRRIWDEGINGYWAWYRQYKANNAAELAILKKEADDKKKAEKSNAPRKPRRTKKQTAEQEALANAISEQAKSRHRMENYATAC